MFSNRSPDPSMLPPPSPLLARDPSSLILFLSRFFFCIFKLYVCNMSPKYSPLHLSQVYHCMRSFPVPCLHKSAPSRFPHPFQSLNRVHLTLLSLFSPIHCDLRCIYTIESASSINPFSSVLVPVSPGGRAARITPPFQDASSLSPR